MTDLALPASALMGLAVATLLWAIFSIVGTASQSEEAGFIEAERRARLRNVDTFYRWFEGLVQDVARLNERMNAEQSTALDRKLSLAMPLEPYRGAEFLAIRQLEGVFVGCCCGAIAYFLGGAPLAAVALLGMVLGYPALAVSEVDTKVEARRLQMRRRLPFAIDLISLMMGAGASFMDAIATVAREAGDHPIAEEFRLLLRSIEQGRTRRDALLAVKQRLQDRDVGEFVDAVVKGEELGTPLADVLQLQSEQLRLKRSQWAEKAAAEAQVNIFFPGFITMIASLSVLFAPFLFRMGGQ